MRTITIAALVAACGTVAPAFAQSATGVGVGIAKSSSTSKSNATAIGGGNATGGAGGSITLNSSIPAAQSINQNVSGTQTVKNVPTVVAPGLTAAGLETCLGSISAGAGVVGTGATFGTTIPDAGCAARLDARTLWSMGLKKAAVARLCLMTDIYNSMPEVCVQYMPQRAPVGYAAPVAELASAEGYAGGPILLIEGRTGQERVCDSYDEARQRCRTWAHMKRPSPRRLPKVITDPPPASPNKVTGTESREVIP